MIDMTLGDIIGDRVAMSDSRPTIEEIFAEAKSVALAYDKNRKWDDWGEAAQEDFWSIAQDCLDIPMEEQIGFPEGLSERASAKK